MNEASTHDEASRDALEEALAATTRQTQRLLRRLRDVDLDEDASKEARRLRRQAKANRELLDLDTSPRRRGGKSGEARGSAGAP